jgi:SAM-dependent methyltransferase
MTAAPGVPPNPVPEFLPFEFSFLEGLQLVIQKRDPRVLEDLGTIYRENCNVGYLQENHDLSVGYGADFLSYIETGIKKYGPAVKTISEIGAGGGYILKKLKDKGFVVSAIDPSPVAVECGRKFKYEVVQEFFPLTKSAHHADLVMHYDVLEHVADPVAFLEAHKNNLNNNGLILFAVPDVSEYLRLGDISMTVHQHLNYFDEESLRLVLEGAGFRALDISKSKHGAVLYCIAQPLDENPKRNVRKGIKKFERFADRYMSLSGNINDYVRRIAASNTNRLGFYVPLRALPYLSQLGMYEGFRFFDDDSGIHGKYFDGFKVPVESFNDLKADPVTHLIITSFAFGEKIRGKVNDSLLGSPIEIRTLSDFQSVPMVGGQ